MIGKLLLGKLGAILVGKWEPHQDTRHCPSPTIRRKDGYRGRGADEKAGGDIPALQAPPVEVRNLPKSVIPIGGGVPGSGASGGSKCGPDMERHQELPIVRMQAAEQGALPRTAWAPRAFLSGAMVDGVWNELDPQHPPVGDPRKMIDERTAPGA